MLCCLVIKTYLGGKNQRINGLMLGEVFDLMSLVQTRGQIHQVPLLKRSEPSVVDRLINSVL